MSYTITIRKTEAIPEPGTYQKSEDVYQQTVDTVDIPAIIAVVNNLATMRREQP